MFLPFALPHQGLQNLRKRMFYWRVVYQYRLLLQTRAFTDNQIGYKFVRFVLAVLLVKSVQKGARALKEEHLHDYAVRKDNIAAAEKAFWEEELGLHAVDTKVAESAVLRQRELDHRFRSSPDLHAEAMHGMMFPIVVRSTAELK